MTPKLKSMVGYELRALCSVHLSVYAAPLGGVQLQP